MFEIKGKYAKALICIVFILFLSGCEITYNEEEEINVLDSINEIGILQELKVSGICENVNENIVCNYYLPEKDDTNYLFNKEDFIQQIVPILESDIKKIEQTLTRVTTKVIVNTYYQDKLIFSINERLKIKITEYLYYPFLSKLVFTTTKYEENLSYGIMKYYFNVKNNTNFTIVALTTQRTYFDKENKIIKKESLFGQTYLYEHVGTIYETIKPNKTSSIYYDSAIYDFGFNRVINYNTLKIKTNESKFYYFDFEDLKRYQ